MKAIVACLLASLLAMSVMVYAQGVGSSGDIRGVVRDPSGAVLPNVSVTATDTATGYQRTTTTDNSGQYHFTGLPPATYDVTTKAEGFATEVRKGLIVGVGRTVIADYALKTSQVSTVVEVTGEPPAVETTRGSQADSVNQQYITDLPIDRRDYLTFTLLMPGVSNATRLAGDQDFRVKQTHQSGLSFYGSNGRGNSVTVDGGEANDDSGGVRLTLSQDAVQEFQINRSNYSAELGGASGASINIVSKTGTNDIHGSAYGFFRGDVFDARNPFAFTQALQPGQAFNPAEPDSVGSPTKDSLSRQQYGATMGGAITKDKTWYFGSFEGLHQNAQNAVPLLTNTSIFRPDSGGLVVNGVKTGNDQASIISGLQGRGSNLVPCLAGQPNLPGSVCAGILQNVLTINPAASPLSSFLVNQLESNGGVFAFDTRQYFASGRLDHVFNDTNQAYVR